MFCFVLFCFLVGLCILAGARSAGCVEAGAGGLRRAQRPGMEVEGGKSWNLSGAELDRFSDFSPGKALVLLCVLLPEGFKDNYQYFEINIHI